MAHVAEIRFAQKSLEDIVNQKMDDLKSQLQTGGTAKDTVAKVAEEFRVFRELVYNIFKLLRKQIEECAHSVDAIETRQRRKALIFTGVTEADKENCSMVALGILQDKMGLKDVTVDSLRSCHRLGSSGKDRPRPLLVRFASLDTRSAVWRAKTRLKGSSIATRKFLTKTRQAVFTSARLHFGLRGTWTQDGIVVIKTPDGRQKITTMQELQSLLQKYPKASSGTAAPQTSGR